MTLRFRMLPSVLTAAVCLAATAADCATVTTLYSFLSLINPEGRIAMDAEGSIYGATEGNPHSGYRFSAGFKLSPPAKKSGAWTAIATTDPLDYSNGYGTIGGVIFAGSQDVAIFGTSAEGGAYDCGTVYASRLTPTGWHQNPIWSFKPGPSDGCVPATVPAEDATGRLYGTTTTGGLYGAGVVYMLVPPPLGEMVWTEQVLYSFPAQPAAGQPDSPLLISGDGALYGNLTQASTSTPYGAVYRLVPPAEAGQLWTYETLWTFSGGDGSMPVGPLTRDEAGALYGTCAEGGAGGVGTVFKLSPPADGGSTWTEATLFAFSTPQGEPESGVVFDGAHHLLGTTTRKGGSLFRLTAPADGVGAWSEAVLFSFTGPAIGTIPMSPLLKGFDGSWYGTTFRGGRWNAGTMFKLTE